MRRLILALVILLASTIAAAAAISCKTKREDDGKYWAWRVIDGKRCWDAGPRGVSKAVLYWRSTARAHVLKPPIWRKGKSAPEANETIIPKDPNPDEILLESIWPEPIPTHTFVE